jgi:sugar phosphate isomerase/epimerase
MPKIGLQLYTVRDKLAQDFLGTLEAVAGLGFHGVELAGNYGGHDAGALKALLGKLGLEVAALHIPIEKLETDLDAQIAFASALGSKYIVCPWLAESRYATDAAFHETCASLERIARACAARGLRLGYHNHTFEFERQVGPQTMFDALFAAAPDALVEFDIAWGHAGGVSSTDYVKKYAGRLPLLHVKDVKRDGAGWQTVELDRGEVPVHASLEASAATGAEWFVLEQDHCAGDPLESVALSVAFLRERGWLS